MPAPINIKLSINHINHLLVLCLVLFGLGLIVMWFRVTPDQPFTQRLAPAQDKLAQNLSLQKINIKGTFTQFSGVPSTNQVLWPTFRGGSYDNVVHQSAALTSNLSSSDLPIRWSAQLGEGYAGAAIAHGRVYVLDYDKEKKSDSLRCFSLNTGEEIWRRSCIFHLSNN